MSLDPRKARITSTFGEWPQWRKDAGLDWHNADDMHGQNANDFGEPIIATHDGTVASVGAFASSSSGYGPTIDHGGFGIQHWHQEQPINISLGLKVGDRVRAGATIGFIGNKGFSTGPHSHCMISVKRNADGFFNFSRYDGWLVAPQAYLNGDYLTDAALDSMFKGDVAVEGNSLVVCQRYVTRAQLDLYANRIISVNIARPDGKFTTYIPGAPSFVNAAFPTVLPQGQVVLIKR
jgi:hypothetical protein